MTPATGAAGRPLRRGLDGKPVPLLRGRLHQHSVIPAGVVGVGATLRADGLGATAALGIFTVSILAMLTASAVYHCHAREGAAKQHARRVDHGTILVAIAGTQTAYWVLLAPGRVGAVMVFVVWIGAVFGYRQKMNHLTALGSTGDWLFGTLGGSGIVLLPWLFATDWITLVLVVSGGASYSVGAVLLHHHLGNLRPRVFGYHELWHCFVIVGVVCHFAGIVRLA